MKKNNKKKRLPGYWLGTRKPTSLGYQPNYGIGNAQFTTVEGEDLTPEVKAAKRNIFPNTLGKITQQATSLSNILSNTVKSAATPSTAAAMNAAGAIAEGGVGARLAAGGVSDYMGSMFYGTPAASSTAGSTAGSAAGSAGATAGKAILNTAGTTLAALGTAYGAYDIYNQFANAGDHRSVSDMRNTLATNTYTTDYGNQYTEYTGLNRQAELDYERAQRLQKRLNLGVSSIGTGASAGALVGSTIFPGLGTGLGTALGAGLGAAFSGIASLFGFGDNEDEIEQQMKDLADTTSRQNRQSRSIAENQDTKDAFYGRAAKGKQPVYSEFGPTNRKETAMVSSGELIGRFKKGRPGEVESQYVVPGPVNNKTKFADNKKANVQDETYIVSNQNIPGTNVPLSAYALATGDVLGALNVQNAMNTNKKKDQFKCGKKPGYAIGTFGEYALATLPGISEYLSNLAWYNRDKYAAVPRLNYEVTTPEADAAINQIMSDQIDPREYINQSNNTYRQAAWNLQRNPAMGLGGRMVMLDALNRAKFAQDAETRMKIDEANRNQRNIGRKYRIENGHLKTQLKDSNFWKSNAMYQQALGAKYTNMKSDTKNQNMGITNALSNALSVNHFNKAMDIQNRTLGIYQQNANIEKLRALKDVYGTVPADSTTSITTTPASTTSTISDTTSIGPSLFKQYTMPNSSFGTIKPTQYKLGQNSDWYKDYIGLIDFNPYSVGSKYLPKDYGKSYVPWTTSPIFLSKTPASTSSSIVVDDRLRGPGRYGYEQPGWSLADKNYMLSLVR